MLVVCKLVLSRVSTNTRPSPSNENALKLGRALRLATSLTMRGPIFIRYFDRFLKKVGALAQVPPRLHH